MRGGNDLTKPLRPETRPQRLKTAPWLAWTAATTSAQRFPAVLCCFLNGEELHFSERFTDPDLTEMRNVAGEIKGSETVLRYCIEHDVPFVTIYHDYEGVWKWATGEWKAKARHHCVPRILRRSRKVHPFPLLKVKGHSGDKYSDLAEPFGERARHSVKQHSKGGCTGCAVSPFVYTLRNFRRKLAFRFVVRVSKALHRGVEHLSGPARFTRVYMVPPCENSVPASQKDRACAGAYRALHRASGTERRAVDPHEVRALRIAAM